jgi:hypothetical protein
MKITLAKLSTKDLATLAQRTINTSESGKYSVIMTHPLLANLKLKYSDYDLVYAKQIYSGKGFEVAEADKQRDLAFVTLKSFLNSYRKMLLLPNYQSAEDLYQVFKTFGLDLYKMSYSSQTAQMKKLIEELEKSENSQKLKALSLEDAFTDMKTKQTDFEKLFAEQASANADLRRVHRESAKTWKSL